MQQIILILHFLFCLSLITLVLIHQGKGSDMGAAFGSGASSTVFGSQGSAPFLFKLIATIAALFFATSLVLSYLSSQIAHQKQSNLLPLPTTQVIPASNTDVVKQVNKK